MICNLPNAKGAMNPLPLAAHGAGIALLIAIQIMVFNAGQYRLRVQTGPWQDFF